MALYGTRITGTGDFTGSISKILISGDNSVGAGATAVFDVISWGTVDSAGTITEVSRITTDMTFPAGSYVEGPICSFKLTSGTVLAFAND